MSKTARVLIYLLCLLFAVVIMVGGTWVGFYLMHILESWATVPSLATVVASIVGGILMAMWSCGLIKQTI